MKVQIVRTFGVLDLRFTPDNASDANCLTGELPHHIEGESGSLHVEVFIGPKSVCKRCDKGFTGSGPFCQQCGVGLLARLARNDEALKLVI